MKLGVKIIIGLILFILIVLSSFFYYAGAKIMNVIQGNPPGTFNNTIALEIPLSLLYYNNVTLKQKVPYECNSSNLYFLTENYSLIPCIKALKINETIKNICLKKQELVENLIIERRDYSKIRLGWASLTDQKIYEITECFILLNTTQN